MATYRVRAIRRQMVEMIVVAQDDEWAVDTAFTQPQSDWDVVETYEVDECFSVTEIIDEVEPWEEA